MKITKYKLELTETKESILVREDIIDYNKKWIECPQTAVDVSNKLYNLDKMAEEHIVLLAMLNGRLIATFLIAQGSGNMCVIKVSSIYTRLIQIGANQYIMLHNHPSGKKEESKSDMAVFKKLLESSKILDIDLTDFIIVAGNDYLSFKEKGLLWHPAC